MSSAGQMDSAACARKTSIATIWEMPVTTALTHPTRINRTPTRLRETPSVTPVTVRETSIAMKMKTWMVLMPLPSRLILGEVQF